MKKCTWCGKEYPDDAKVCSIDGRPLEGEQTQTQTGPGSPVGEINLSWEMLTELRKLRKLNLFTLILTLVSAAGCVLLIIAFLIGAQYRSTRQTTARTSSRSNPWSQVRTAVEEQDFARALTLANDVIARNPSDYYGYTYLGYVYLALGDLTNSQANYQRAFELWPVEENEKNLNAIKSRIAIEHQKQLEKK